MTRAGWCAGLALIAIAGCGSDDKPGGAPDAAVGDAGVTPDGPPGPGLVRVVFRSEGLGVDRQPVVVHDPSGAVIAMTQTNFEGAAEARVPPGSTVSVLVLFQDDEHGVFSWQGVMPGDVLEANDAPRPTYASGNITLRVPNPGPAMYVADRCNEGGRLADNGVVTLRPCPAPNRFLLSSAGTAFYSPELTYAVGDEVDLSAAQLRPKRELTLRAINVPPLAQFGRMSTTLSINDRGLRLMPTEYDDFDIVGDAGELTTMVTDLPGQPVIARLSVGAAVGTVVMARAAALPTLNFFDFATVKLPATSMLGLSDGAYRWTETGSGAVDYVYVRARARVKRLYHSLAAPHTGAALRLPVFPAPYEAWNPRPEDTMDVFDFGIARVTGGWRAAAAHVLRSDYGELAWLVGDLVGND